MSKFQDCEICFEGMSIDDLQEDYNILNFGFVHSRHDLTRFGEYVWKIYDQRIKKEVLLIINQEYKVSRYYFS